MNNPLKSLTKKEWCLWLVSLIVVVISNLFAPTVDWLTMIAACVGVTSLVWAAVGNVWSQVLMVVFSILYGIISWNFRYWGEMITYLGMTMPMAVWATITWLKNPSENGREVAIQRLTTKHIVWVVISAILVTLFFGFLLHKLDTPNIVFSIISITTSFVAAALTMLRSSYFALWYVANDGVLIVLWVLAAMENLSYIPVVVNFVIFFLNDFYGFVCWKKREKRTLDF